MNNDLKRAIQQLYENERLTSDLMDPAAKLLLGWGADQLRALADRNPTPEQVEAVAYPLQRLIRSINTLISQRTSLDEAEYTQRVLKLAEQAAEFARQTMEINPDGEETQKL